MSADSATANFEPPRKVKGVGFRERYMLVGKSRVGSKLGLTVSLAAHLAMFGGALLYAHLAPPRVVPEKPIVAKLVRLGKPRDEKMLPRLPSAPPPPPPQQVAVSTPNAPPPNPSSTAKSIDAKPEPPKERANEALERQKKLMEALEKLGPAPDGPTAKVAEAPVGREDGDKLGDSDTAAEGDRYLALVEATLRRSYTLPNTISEKERMYLACDVFVKIGPDGQIVDSRIENSSHNDQFDDAVTSGLKQMKLPPPPKAFLDKYPDGLEIHYKP